MRAGIQVLSERAGVDVPCGQGEVSFVSDPARKRKLFALGIFPPGLRSQDMAIRPVTTPITGGISREEMRSLPTQSCSQGQVGFGSARSPEMKTVSTGDTPPEVRAQDMVSCQVTSSRTRGIRECEK